MYEINYNEIYLLDAEDLAEGGVAEAYDELVPELLKYIEEPAQVIEYKDDNKLEYYVTSLGKTYYIYGPELEDNEGQHWGRAAYALFTIVNQQLEDHDVRIYGINGGNDLCGVFLSKSQYEDSKESIHDKSDWPYIVKLEHPSYGHLFP